MSSSRLIFAAALIAAFGIHSASALEVEDNSTTKAGVNLTDPDDNVPVAHLGDDGKMQSPSGFNLQMQGGSQSAGYGLSNSGPSAFDRAQQNQMGQ